MPPGFVLKVFQVSAMPNIFQQQQQSNGIRKALSAWEREFFQLFDKSVLLVNFFYCVLEIKQTKATSSLGPPEVYTVTLFLRIDKGRYDNIPRDERLCSLCNCKKIEDETHFL